MKKENLKKKKNEQRSRSIYLCLPACLESISFLERHLVGQNYVTDSVRYRLQHQPLDVVGCGVETKQKKIGWWDDGRCLLQNL